MTNWEDYNKDKFSVLTEVYKPLEKEHLEKYFSPKLPTGSYMMDNEFEGYKKRAKKEGYELESDEVLKQHKHLLELHAPHYTSDNIDTITRYTDGDTGNRSLVTHKGSLKTISDKVSHHAAGHIENIDKVFKSVPPLDHTVHAYSGLGEKFNPTSKFAKNDGVIHMPAFTSTSINPVIAYGIGQSNAGYGSKNPHTHVIHFELPQGYKHSAYLSGSSKHDYYHKQRELLINRGQKFKLQGKQTLEHRDEYGSKHKVTVWHVKPHEEALNETYEHRPDALYDRNERSTEEYPNHKELARRSAKEEATKQHEEFSKQETKTTELPEHIKGALKNYQGSGSRRMNRYLLGEKTEHPLVSDRELVHIEHISNHIKETKPLENSIHTYSGMGTSFNGHNVFEHNDTFHSPAFLSTSLDPTYAHQYADERNHKDTPVHDKHILHFHLPKGYNRGRYIGNDGGIFDDEREYLLDKNQKWKKTGYQHIVNHYDRGKSIGSSTQHVHVWSLEPHEDHITETFIHHEKALHDFSGKDTKASLVADADAEKQHKSMPKPKLDSISKMVLNEHLASSTKVNNYLIKKHRGNDNWTSKDDVDEDRPISDESLSFRANLIDKTISTHATPLKGETHVYSGTGNYSLGHLKKHDVLHTPAFTSTTLNPSVAHNFSAPAGYEDDNDHQIIHFELPKGYNKGLYLGHKENNKHMFGERELLLNRGQNWKVKNIKNHKRGRTVTVIPHEDHLTETYRHDPQRFSGSVIYDAWGDHSHSYTSSDGDPILHTDIAGDVARQNDHLHKNLPKFKAFHKAAIKAYSTSSRAINEAMIRKHAEGKSNMFYDAHAKKISEAIAASHPIDHEMHVYSGLKEYNPAQHFDVASGTIHMPAFTSTSIDPLEALNFRSDSHHSHIMHFELPQGYHKGLYMEPHTMIPGEHEMLLDKGQTWKLHKKTKTHILIKKNLDEVPEKHAITVWSVKPHNHNLNETTTHAAGYWRGVLSGEGRSAVSKDINSDIHKDVNKQHKLMGMPKLSPQSKEIIKQHSDGSDTVNRHLIYYPKGTPISPLAAPTHQKANDLSNTIEQNSIPLSHEVHAYSGTGNHNPRLWEGQVMHTPAFTSTSINPEVASQFTNDTVIHFHLPAGYRKGLYLGHKSNNPHYSEEHEYLLDKDQKWKVTHVQEHEHGKIMTVIPHDD